MGKFSDVYGISRLTLSTLSGSSGKVYANGRQQVLLYVTLELTDQHYNAVTLDGDGLKKLQDNIFLCDYFTGKPLIDLDKDNAVFNDWAYSKESNEWAPFPITMPYNSVYATNTRIVIPFYVQCPKGNTSAAVNVAAAVKINEEVFDTLGGDGFDCYVNIQAVEPITYRFAAGSLKVIEKTVFERLGGSDGYHEFGKIYSVIAMHNNQEIKFRKIYKRVQIIEAPSPYKDNVCYTDHSLDDECPLRSKHFYAIMAACLRGTPRTSAYLESWYVTDTGNARNFYYDFSGREVNGNHALGLGGYYDYFPINSNRNKFLFAVSRRQTWANDEKPMGDYLNQIIFTFQDEYGNDGRFFANVGNHYTMNNDHHINSDWKFTDV